MSKAIFSSLFKLKIPIVGAPMAGVSGHALAAEVTKAGGLGFIAAGYMTDSKTLVGEIEQAKKSLNVGANETQIPFGIGYITFHLNSHPHLLLDVLKYQPKAIWFSFGDCRKWFTPIREQSPETRIFVQVQSVAEAIVMADHGADVIVSQGSESGGHGAKNNGSTLTLLPEIVDNLSGEVPVLAAGGIIDGRGIVAALSLGADGVVLGTSLLASHESKLHPNFKQKVIATKDGGKSTIRTQIFDQLRDIPWDLEVYDGRALTNSVTCKFEQLLTAAQAKELQPDFQTAMTNGDPNIGVIFAGSGVGLVNSKKPAGQIVQGCHQEAIELLQKLSSSKL
ncbi:2-nitropropane dioxygenase, NPD [Basidiobolus meristosporus CBS 931.73]|uniref:2-nitropropane dioxygenase, NPD n=1 Tax=Basidiobolus meristosporus CBS 931.73 TaxID=1314790 RepID=A0A1Y1YVC8_9FUNG|nr:2-nitropropane dioxygenase, NPD [Basidiobolus meristosporus CBS 931.73]|eukprot:ORY01929.1 2-nitropropane dioxygenase, NPD [Basidiobolus meristosporus CBS 931.73]